MAFKYSCPIEVRFRDCDPMGHVNNAVYPTYLEVARFAYWRDVCGGRNWGEIGFIMARIEFDYKAPVEQGDTVHVRLGITKIGRTSFDFEYELVDQHDRLVGTARTVQVMYDYAMKKPVPVPDAFRQQVAGFEGVTP
jgi:acyl-CoA thioester hydrolase